MKRVTFLLSLAVLFCTYFMMPQPSFAHLGGVPILKINGQMTKAYMNTIFSSQIFDLPPDTDASPETYIINQTLEFEVDTVKLPALPETIEKADFIWDYGDNSQIQTTKNGVKTSHIYTKSGMYVVTVVVDYEKADPQLAGLVTSQTVLVYVLPDKNYKLPIPMIRVNGQTPTDSERLAIDIDMNERIHFDASGSTPGTTKIVEYIWDFDDTRQRKKKSTSHRYNLPRFYVTPKLRLKDANGFFVDAYVNLTNIGKNDINNVNPEFEDSVYEYRFLLLIPIAAVCGIAAYIFIKRRRKTKG